jgi:hypothetical protein
MQGLIQIKAGNYLPMFLCVIHGFQKRIAGVIQEADYLLAAVNDLVVTQTTGISQGHRSAFRILGYMFDTNQKILHFSRLLSDGLRQDYFQPIRIGSLSASYRSHVGPVGTAAGDYLVAGKHKSVAQHFHKLLMSQRQVAGSDDSYTPRSGLLNQQ